MDYQLILLGTIAAIVILAILVLGGLVLSARSYTALLEVVASLGSLAERLLLARLPAQTTSSTETELGTKSAPKDTTPTTQDHLD